MRAVYFPYMHKELSPDILPKGVCLMNPGVIDEIDRDFIWLPDNLPFSKSEAKKFLQESMGFGEQFSRPRDLSYFLAGPWEDHFSETTMGIKKDYSISFEDKKQDNQAQYALKGQMTLLLAWQLEETISEMENLETGYQNQWETFGRILGLEEIDHEELKDSQNFDQVSEKEDLIQVYPWTKVLPWFLFFLNQKDYLVVNLEQIKLEWQDNGVDFSEVSSQDLPFLKDVDYQEKTTVLQAEAEGWKLALEKKSRKFADWLQKKYKVIYIAK